LDGPTRREHADDKCGGRHAGGRIGRSRRLRLQRTSVWRQAHGDAEIRSRVTKVALRVAASPAGRGHATRVSAGLRDHRMAEMFGRQRFPTWGSASSLQQQRSVSTANFKHISRFYALPFRRTRCNEGFFLCRRRLEMLLTQRFSQPQFIKTDAPAGQVG
jgi:hypothetical protein